MYDQKCTDTDLIRNECKDQKRRYAKLYIKSKLQEEKQKRKTKTKPKTVNTYLDKINRGQNW